MWIALAASDCRRRQTKVLQRLYELVAGVPRTADTESMRAEEGIGDVGRGAVWKADAKHSKRRGEGVSRDGRARPTDDGGSLIVLIFRENESAHNAEEQKVQTMNESKNGLKLVYSAERKTQRAETMEGVREGSTGRLVRRMWAVGEAVTAEAVVAPMPAPQPEMAFYRKYTEAMLRRYLRMSMEAGRTPSLLGRELFRSKVTSYRVKSFEDVVIFCFDMEKCLEKLTAEEAEVIKRVALQEYTHGEAATMMGLSLRMLVVRYGRALDRLTRLLLEKKLLEPQKLAQ